MRLDSFTTSLLGLALACLLLSGCLDDVGDQDGDGSGQFATATAIGLPAAAAGGFAARTESEVTLSGKDSDSPSSPIFEFIWEQISGPPVDLFERDASSRSFTAPGVESVLEFRLTVVNVNGEMTSDTVMINVTPVIDTNEFLRDPRTDETFFLFVSPRDPGQVTSTTSYSLTVTPVVRWEGRERLAAPAVGGVPQTIELDPILETCDDMMLCDEVLSGFVASSNPLDPSQTHYAIQVPLLDFDEVNKFFQGDERGGRLEFEAVDGATVELQVSFNIVSGSTDLEVFVARESSGFLAVDPEFLYCERENAALEIIEFCRRDDPPEAIPDLDNAAAILDGTRSEARLDLEALRQELGIESKASAANYYDCIDPNDQATTLDDWLEQAGFNDPANQDSITRARYVNNYDLGFGRDMFLRTDEDGNVFTYVVNYPSLESLLKSSGEFATVVMEYSPALEAGEDCGSRTFSMTEKIVKFYAYAPNSLTGEMERLLSQNFDGRGERFLPGVCTACHEGFLERIEAFSPVIPSDGTTARATQMFGEISGANADLLATFMPWDLDSMLYARAADRPDLVDPSFEESNFTPEEREELDEVSLENQQDAFRRLNEGAIATYLDDPEAFEAPLRLVHGWYGNTNIPSPIEDNPRSTLATLNAQDFDGTFVEEGWAGQEALYQNVHARYCRMCHIVQQEEPPDLPGDPNRPALTFDTYDEFIGNSSSSSSSSLENQIFETGLMPRSRLTLDRFWLDFDGDEAAAEILRTHLRGLGRVVDGVPGLPQANISIVDGSGSTFQGTLPPLTEVDEFGELVESTVTLLGDDSLFADTFAWSVTTEGAGCPPTANLMAEDTAQAMLTVGDSMIVDNSPCAFTATLEVTSALGSDSATTIIQTDRVPEIPDPDTPLVFVPIDDLTYEPGNNFVDVAVLSQIDETMDGDGNLFVVVDNDGEEVPPEMDDGIAANPNVSIIGDEMDPTQIRFMFPFLSDGTQPVLGGIEATLPLSRFGYKIEDGDGSRSEDAGTVTVGLDAIMASGLAQSGTTETSTTVSWNVDLPSGYTLGSPPGVPDGDFSPARYVVVRTDLGSMTSEDLVPTGPITDTTYEDSGLSTGQNYEYQVFIEVANSTFPSGTERSPASEVLSVTTSVGQPTLDEVEAARTVSTAELLATPAAVGIPESYDLFLDEVRVPDMMTGGPILVGPDPVNITVTGLAQNSQFEFTLTQTIGGIQSDPTPIVFAITLPAAPTLPAEPVSGETTDELVVEWFAPAGGGAPGSYRITIAPPPPPFDDPTDVFTTLTGLTPDTQYTMSIQSIGILNDLSASTTNFIGRTQVSFDTNIAPLNGVLGGPPGDGFSTNCRNCHTDSEYKTHIENNITCMTNDPDISDCASAFPVSAMMSGVSITDTDLTELLIRWRDGDRLD